MSAHILRNDGDVQWGQYWAGFDGRITKMGGDPEKAWINRRLGKLFSYDPGQILDLYLESETGLKDINIFEFPGGEVCSSFVASCFDCGNTAIGRPGLADFEGWDHVRETADIAPGHFSDKGFEIIGPEDPIYAGYVKIYLNWREPGPDIKLQLLTLIAQIIARKPSIGLLRDIWLQNKELFHDGIKQVSRDYFKIPHPYYLATHSDLIWRDPEGDMIRCVGQEAYLRQYDESEITLRRRMAGNKPEVVVAKPKFLYY